jgi:sec-independent protein translocase protein TatA
MYPLLFLGKLGATEIILILVIVLLFFGGRKIPELMRGLGRGVKEFKDASKGEGETSSTPEKK